MTEAKPKLSITLDAEVVGRVDAIAEARGESRSAVIERMLKSDLPHEEQFLRDMEVPLNRMIAETMGKHPRLLMAIAKAIGEEMDDEKLAVVQGRINEITKRGKQRREAKRQGSQQSISDEGAVLE